jgi:hypothetical protein
VRLARWFSTSALAAALLLSGGMVMAGAEKTSPKEIAAFGVLRATAPETARNQALDWLKGVGKTDETTLKAFEAIWKGESSVLEKVAASLVLGDPAARALLDEARDPESPAPTQVPALLKDAKKPVFYRANLALAYAKSLSGRRIYEEALDTLSSVKVEQVVEPATYLFHKAVAEHALTRAREAQTSIVRLLDDVPDAPERYKTVAALMVFDMLTWKEKDLGEIARKMDNIERRLDLARGGPTTRKIQKEVVARLDEIIKELENQARSGGS